VLWNFLSLKTTKRTIHDLWMMRSVLDSSASLTLLAPEESPRRHRALFAPSLFPARPLGGPFQIPISRWVGSAAPQFSLRVGTSFDYLSIPSSWRIDC
jgi:hypothetical protein